MQIVANYWSFFAAWDCKLWTKLTALFWNLNTDIRGRILAFLIFLLHSSSHWNFKKMEILAFFSSSIINIFFLYSNHTCKSDYAMLLFIVKIPFHRRTLRLVVISLVVVSWSTIHSQPPPYHAAALPNALPNAPAPSSAHLVPSKMKTIRLRVQIMYCWVLSTSSRKIRV